MRTQMIFFDLDDTLIHCNKYFIEALSTFADYMQKHFPRETRKDILAKQLQLDLAGVDLFGLKKERFPDSLIETFDYFLIKNSPAATHPKIDNDVRAYLWDLGHEVYEQQFEAYPYMEQTLQELQDQGHTLCLYTGGDKGVQQEKIKQLELRRYFDDRIFITEHKNTVAIKQVLSELSADLKHTWMIGNSARTDIIPALEAGIHAIFIPNEIEWAYNKAEIDTAPQGVFVEVKQLREVPRVITSFIGISH